MEKFRFGNKSVQNRTSLCFDCVINRRALGVRYFFRIVSLNNKRQKQKRRCFDIHTFNVVVLRVSFLLAYGRYRVQLIPTAQSVLGTYIELEPRRVLNEICG